MKENWILDIVKELTVSRAQLHQVNDFTWNINNQLICFVPAQTDFYLDEREAILIHEDFYHTRKAQLLSRLRSQLGLNTKRIHGRMTRIAEVNRNQAEKFVNENHLMGFSGGKTFVGLFFKEELVAVATFSKIILMRYEEPTYYSVMHERFCSASDITVVGGLDKLMRYYAKTYKTDDIVTQIDSDWSFGKSYLKLGFEKVSVTPPILFAVDKVTFTRRVILSKEDLTKSEYFVQNRGNLKLQKRLKHDPQK